MVDYPCDLADASATKSSNARAVPPSLFGRAPRGIIPTVNAGASGVNVGDSVVNRDVSSGGAGVNAGAAGVNVGDSGVNRDVSSGGAGVNVGASGVNVGDSGVNRDVSSGSPYRFCAVRASSE